jgi:glycosyltransferase involved in cell wall biosynthesis
LAELDDLLSQHGTRSWTTRCQFLSGAPKQSAFAASDIFALPSLNENFGIAVVEAMYARLPVLVSNEVYIHEVIVSGGAGRVCEPTVTSCSSELQRMLSDEHSRRQMAHCGPIIAQHHFGPEVVLERLEATYRNLLEYK